MPLEMNKINKGTVYHIVNRIKQRGTFNITEHHHSFDGNNRNYRMFHATTSRVLRSVIYRMGIVIGVIDGIHFRLLHDASFKIAYQFQ